MTERRLFFRIDDGALLRYRLVEAAELDKASRGERPQRPADELVGDALDAIRRRLNRVVSGFAADQPLMAEIVDLLDRRLGRLERLAEGLGPAAADPAVRAAPPPVNLSGGGLAFAAAEALAEGSVLALDLILLPGCRLIQAYGRVVDCRAGAPPCSAADQSCVAVDFLLIDEDDREALVRHVLRRQAENLRLRREAGDSPPP